MTVEYQFWQPRLSPDSYRVASQIDKGDPQIPKIK
jgi:hypothetical protein